MKKQPARNMRVLLLALSGLAVSCLVLALYMGKSKPFEFIDHKLYDACLRNTVHARSSSANPPSLERLACPVLVDIDTKSLKALGQWPWPRIKLAKIIEKLRGAGAIAIGIDILMDSPDRTSPLAVQTTLNRDLGLELDLSGLPPIARDNDYYLGEVLENHPTVLGFYFLFSPNRTTALENKADPPDQGNLSHFKATLKFEDGAAPEPGLLHRNLFQSSGAAMPLPMLTGSGKKATFPGTGFMNVSPDRDGTLRRIPLLISYKTQVYPQLALSTLLVAMEQLDAAHPLRKTANDDPVIRLGPNGVKALEIKDTAIPLGGKGTLLINYQGPSHTFPYIPALDILDKETSELLPQIDGRIVFIGSTAPVLKDIVSSPLDTKYPGLEIHATIVHNIVSRNFISKPSAATAMDLILILLCGGLTTVFIIRFGPKASLAVTLALGGAVFYGTHWALAHHRIHLSAFYPLLAMAQVFFLINLVKFALAEKDKRFYRKAFGKYVSKTVVDAIVADPESLNLAGEEKEITVLFTDIRGFSGISEKIMPHQVSRLLNEYFTPLSRIVIQHQGTMDKFIGDALMCFWNAPVAVENHQEKALLAAIEMTQALCRLNRTFQSRFGLELKMGVGLNAGICRVGNMGSEDLFDYTALGDQVNLASRIEGLTKFYGLDILFSKSVKEKITDGKQLPKNARVCEVDMVRVKGKREPVRIFTLLFPNSPDGKCAVQTLDMYHSGLAFYRNRQFRDAVTLFQTLVEKCPGHKLYRIYLTRASGFRDAPPDKDWSGVFTHTSK